MTLEDLVREWAAAERALVDAALAAPPTDSPEWDAYCQAGYSALVERERVARYAIRAWWAADQRRAA